ncbi:MAG: prepilin peptidase [Proteobacteria bacterium]|nr:prepilin peptidase [Pseudomonadota bacterium]
MKLLQQEANWLKTELQTPAPYALTCAGAIMAYSVWPQQPVVAPLTLLAFLLGLQALVDARRTMLPHTLNAAIATLGFIIALTMLGLPLWQVALAPFAAFGGLWAMAWLAEKLTQKPALGGGDLWLVSALAPWLGLSGLLPFLAFTALIGLAVVASRMLQKTPPKKRKTTFAFGPTLAAAGWLALLYGDLYWHLILPR